MKSASTRQKNSASTKKPWFSDLLDRVDLSTTHFIAKRVPQMKFVLLGQTISNSFVERKIAFYDGSHMVCQATNKVVKNALVNEWIEKNPNEPFGAFFVHTNTERTFISKTENSRKYSIIGDIQAEIEETFYPLPC